MNRIILTLLLALLPLSAHADVVFSYDTGQSLYVRFSDSSSTAVDLTEGSTLQAGLYTASDAAIDSAGLAAGTYSGRIFLGTASGQSSADVLVGIVPEFIFGASAQTTSYEELVAQIIASTPLAGFFANQPPADVDEEAIADAVVTGIEGQLGQTQPRINREPSPFTTIQVSRRTDGTYKATRPIRLTAGPVSNVFVFIDMSPLFGRQDFVETVGTATISGGSITQGAEKGPRDWYAVMELDGTATAGEERTVTVPVTMTSGTTLDVVFDVEVLGE